MNTAVDTAFCAQIEGDGGGGGARRNRNVLVKNTSDDIAVAIGALDPAEGLLCSIGRRKPGYARQGFRSRSGDPVIAAITARSTRKLSGCCPAGQAGLERPVRKN